jgi:hypothetical protein
MTNFLVLISLFAMKPLFILAFRSGPILPKAIVVKGPIQGISVEQLSRVHGYLPLLASRESEPPAAIEGKYLVALGVFGLAALFDYFVVHHHGGF